METTSGPRPERQRLLEMAGNFQEACILGAAAELDLFTAIVAGSSTVEELAGVLKADRRGLATLLDALAALGLLTKAEGRYVVPPASLPLLSSTSPDSILPMIWHRMNILRGWSMLAWTVKSGVPAPRPASIQGAGADLAAFVAAMHTVSGPIADGVVARFGPPPFRHLLDVGGASGTWTLALLRTQPDARATIFDLPHAIEQARGRIARTEFAGRVDFAAGDFDRDELPGDADLAWVSAIVHQNPRSQNRNLFAKVYRALAPGGIIAIRDVVMEPDRTRPLAGALFAINMLANTPEGGTFTFAELAEDLEAAGFRDPDLAVRDEAMSSIVTARRP